MPRKSRTDVEKERFEDPRFREFLKKQLHAILFSVGRRIDLVELSRLCKIKYEDGLRELVKELKQDYDSQDSPMMIVEDKDAWKMTVRERYIPIIQKIVPETEISKGVLETLAVIAFKHPILQSELVDIRSNKAYDHLAELEETGFVVREPYRRTQRIKLTKKFFDYFDLPPDKMKDAFAGFEAVESVIKQKEEDAGAVLPPDDKVGDLDVYGERPGDADRAAESQLKMLSSDGNKGGMAAPVRGSLFEAGAIPALKPYTMAPEEAAPLEGKGVPLMGRPAAMPGLMKSAPKTGISDEGSDILEIPGEPEERGLSADVDAEDNEPLTPEEEEKAVARMQAFEKSEEDAAARAEAILAGSFKTELPESIQKRIDEKVESLFLRPKEGLDDEEPDEQLAMKPEPKAKTDESD